MNPEQPKTFEEKLEELMALADWLYPDPVDLYEDELARRLGLVRHPSAAYEEWRRQRVAFIESHPRADEAAAQMDHDDQVEPLQWSKAWNHQP